MFEFLQPADRPVIDGLEHHEIVMAKNQPQYNPLRCLASSTPQGARLSRWTLTPEQRAAVASGADVFLELWTFNAPMNPIRMAVSDAPNADYFEHVYSLKAVQLTFIVYGHPFELCVDESNDFRAIAERAYLKYGNLMPGQREELEVRDKEGSLISPLVTPRRLNCQDGDTFHVSLRPGVGG